MTATPGMDADRMRAKTIFTLCGMLAAVAMMQGCARYSVYAAQRSPAMALALTSAPHLVEVEVARLRYDSPALRAGLRAGWREEDSSLLVVHSDCLWATSIESELEVSVLQPRDLRLALSLRPHFAEHLGPQRVDVFWNGSAVGTCAFSHQTRWGIVEFNVEVPRAAQRLGKNTVTFLSRYALSAEDAGRGGPHADARRVGFGLHALELREAGTDSADAPQSAQTATAAQFDGDTISQAPNTRLYFPLRVPERGRCVFRVRPETESGALARGVVTLRRDMLDGVEERQLFAFEPGRAQSKAFAFDLTEFKGEFVELVFDTALPGAQKPVIWHRPVVTMPRRRSAAAIEAPPTSPKHVSKVIVIVLDALRASGLRSTGALRDVSPFIDGLLEGALVFDRAYSQASWTYPSVVSLLTGLYPLAHGVSYVDDLLGEDVVTLQETLAAAGIETGCIAENPFFAEPYGLERGFDAFQYIYPAQVEDKDRRSGDVTTGAIEFLNACGEQPCFLYLHYFPPHAPYAAQNPFQQTFTIDPIETIPPVDDAMHAAEIGRAPKTREAVRQLRARYDENVRYVDNQLERLFTAMQELGCGEETAIFITADHGEEFDEHGHLGHSDPPYDTLIRAPLIFRLGPAPGGVTQHVSSPARLIDLLPTACSLLGIASDPALPGRNLFAAAPPRAPETPLNYAVSQSRDPYEAYVWQRYKLIRDPAGTRVEVYDLEHDPDEQTNLAPLRPVLADYLLAHALAWRSRQTPDDAVADKIELKEESQELLKALGYL